MNLLTYLNESSRPVNVAQLEISVWLSLIDDTIGYYINDLHLSRWEQSSVSF